LGRNHCLQAACDAKLIEDAAHVALDRPRTDVEAALDHLVRQTFAE
jgi:hypothetical protein